MNKAKMHLYIIMIFLSLIMIQACRQPVTHKITINGNALGTYYTIHVYHSDSGKVFVQQFQNDVDSVLRYFNSVASVYDTSSVISAINSNRPYEMSPLFQDVFLKSIEISELTDGAFDITVGPLVNAWGFGFADSSHITQELIDSLLCFTGYKNVSVVHDKIEKKFDETLLDMNGIAKGYAVDLVALHIESMGIDSYIVEIGGEVRTGKRKPDGSKWVVAIEKPAENADAAQQEEKRIYLEQISVATSGSYRRYYERGGEKFSHTIDPSTGYPVKHSMLSATIIAADCMTADALATACMVLGAEKALLLCEKISGVEGFFIESQQDKTLLMYYTSGFESYLSE
jgi:FAD:protein FMN transferase